MSEGTPTKRIPVIPNHESPVRRILSDAHQQPYHPLRTLAEAQSYPDGAVIFEGDYGGQIYATCPASMIRCDEAMLDRLLSDLDALCWCDLTNARVFYERRAIGKGVSGGMGGGRITDDVWVHPRIASLNLTSAIRDTLLGLRKPEASVYYDLPPWGEAEVGGFTFGKIEDNRSRGDGHAWGNGFVVAPDGSRAGLRWHVIETAEQFAARERVREKERRYFTDPEYFEVRHPFEPHRWGIWNVAFPHPMHIEDPVIVRDDARMNLEAILPKLWPEWQRWRAETRPQHG